MKALNISLLSYIKTDLSDISNTTVFLLQMILKFQFLVDKKRFLQKILCTIQKGIANHLKLICECNLYLINHYFSNLSNQHLGHLEYGYILLST